MQADRLKGIKSKIYHMSVLYVEDDKDVREQTTKNLELFFSKVVSFENAVDGLSYFKSNPVDIVFTDINMPQISGLEMIEKIKKIDPNVKVVIFSAYDKTEFFTKAIALGVDMYILKPFTIEKLLDTFEKIAQTSKNLIYLDGGFYWDKKSSNLLKENRSIKLTKNEILLLELLLSSKNKIISSLDIENAVFDDDLNNNKRVRNLISRFNKKIGYMLIENIYSQGYKIKCIS
ncbi:MAG: response regulator transcription factor [Campylobacteraceae bacterium]|nr:response regulator transcription factor [Campylobacteraceae bacterium]